MNDLDTEFVEELQDWSTVNSRDESLPRREGKFFDLDGSETQMDRLQQARAHMYLALLCIRGHHAKQLMVAVWFPARQKALVPHAKGSFFKDIGVAHTYKIKPKFQGMWLSPLEAVYLVERGSLVMYLADTEFESFLESPDLTYDYMRLRKLPLSHFYSLALGADLDLVDQYETYALLKRLGYLILERPRALTIEPLQTAKTNSKAYHILFWSSLIRSVTSLAKNLLQGFYGLLYNGSTHFFTYTQVYRSLRLFPSYRPSQEVPSLDQRYRIIFDVWKPTPSFSKKNPKLPDFQVVVVNSERIPFPSVSVMKALWSQVKTEISPTSQEKPEKRKPAKFLSKKEERLKKKSERDLKLNPEIRKRNEYISTKDKLLKNGSSGTKVVLAVVDTGVINFSVFNETDFSLSAPAAVETLNELENRPDHGIVWNEKVK